MAPIHRGCEIKATRGVRTTHYYADAYDFADESLLHLSAVKSPEEVISRDAQSTLEQAAHVVYLSGLRAQCARAEGGSPRRAVSDRPPWERRFASTVATIELVISIVPFSQAETKKITIYSDGASCPANCNAHVVFHKDMNGGEFAHKPGTKYTSCKRNEICRICFGSGEKQCLEVMYRGNGPHKNTFDFTPAFYKQACSPPHRNLC